MIKTAWWPVVFIYLDELTGTEASAYKLAMLWLMDDK